MRTIVITLATVLALCAIAVGLISASVSNANSGGCPNPAAANGVLHANQHSAPDAHCATPLPSPTPTGPANCIDFNQNTVCCPFNCPTPTPCTDPACITRTPTPTPTTSPTPTATATTGSTPSVTPTSIANCVDFTNATVCATFPPATGPTATPCIDFKSTTVCSPGPTDSGPTPTPCIDFSGTATCGPF